MKNLYSVLGIKEDEITKKEEHIIRFQTFGNKKLNLIKIYTKETIFEVVSKTYTCQDITMKIFGDNNYREFIFFGSELYKDMSEIFEIPFLLKDDSKKILYMYNVSHELSEFGPPEIPTNEQMKILITKTAEKDALFLGKKYNLTENSGENIKNFINLFQNGELWDWFYEGVKKLSGETGDDYEKLIIKKFKNVPSLKSEIPYTCNHGDFYFSNVGLGKEKPVVIDWESINYGPIGTDFVSLTDGIPSFTEEMYKWYTDTFNKYSKYKITKDFFIKLCSEISEINSYISKTTDAMKFGFNEKIPIEIRKNILNDFKEWIKK